MNKKSVTILAQGRRVHAIAIGGLSVTTLFLAWCIVSGLHLIAPRFLPTPWRVVRAATDLKPSILVHAAYTASLVFVGLSSGAMLGVYVGVMMRKSFISRSALTPLIEAWRPVPAVAVIPFFIIWFGFAWYGKLLLVGLASFLVVVVGVVEAIDRIDPVYFRVALSFGADSSRLVDEVVLPAILPSLLAPLRIALAVAVTVAVVAEFMGATRGLGHVLNVAMNTYATHTILLCAITLGVIGGGMDLALRKLHNSMIPWAKAAKEALESPIAHHERRMR